MTTTTTTTNKKVFISFLGASNYGECKYLIEGKTSRSVRYVQEAMLEHYARQGWSSHDHAYILLTDIAKQKNWENDGHRDRDTHEIIRQSGLRDCLEHLDLPMTINVIEQVPPGNNEKEIMRIFSLLFTLIEDGDELYFDITHGFRYLPMITLVLGNYSKFLKNVSVKWIGYGNYEGRNFESNIAQVVNLTAMSMLQDWTTAAADFINNGNAKEMVLLTQRQLEPILKEAKGSNANALAIKRMAGSLDAVVDDIKNCRGFNIIEATNVKRLNNNLNDIEDCMIDPLVPLLEKIRDGIRDFDVHSRENIINGFAASEWCLSNNMAQQAATILQETVITSICLRHSLNHKEESQRNIASKALNVKANEMPVETWVLKYDEYEPFKSIMENEQLLSNTEFLETYRNLANLRNDLNHCGMRNNPMRVSQLIARIKDMHQSLFNILIER